jgi:hypothetical protein
MARRKLKSSLASGRFYFYWFFTGLLLAALSASSLWRNRYFQPATSGTSGIGHAYHVVVITVLCLGILLMIFMAMLWYKHIYKVNKGYRDIVGKG